MFLSRFVDIFPSRLAVVDKDLSSAKALHEQMQTEGVPADELSLKRLAALYRNHGETAPFPEPPVSHAHTHARVWELVTRSDQVCLGSNAQEIVPSWLLAYRKRSLEA